MPYTTSVRGAHPAEILVRFRDRLRLVLNVSDDRCFIAEDAKNIHPETMPDTAYIITSEGASYNADQNQFGGFLVKTQYIDVTCFNRLAAIDESSRAHSLVSPYEQNLFEMERRVLRALVGWRLDLPDRDPIEIASLVMANRSGRPEFLSTEDGSQHAAFLSLTFSVSFSVDICNEAYDV